MDRASENVSGEPTRAAARSQVEERSEQPHGSLQHHAGLREQEKRGGGLAWPWCRWGDGPSRASGRDEAHWVSGTRGQKQGKAGFVSTTPCPLLRRLPLSYLSFHAWPSTDLLDPLAASLAIPFSQLEPLVCRCRPLLSPGSQGAGKQVVSTSCFLELLSKAPGFSTHPATECSASRHPEAPPACLLPWLQLRAGGGPFAERGVQAGARSRCCLRDVQSRRQ